MSNPISSSKIPIITGIGHETDFTISDFVADLRAATPSHAAEIVVSTLDGLMDKLSDLKDELINSMEDNINDRFNNLDSILSKLKLYSPENYVVNQYDKLDNLRSKLFFSIEFKLQDEKNKLSIINHRLIGNNPLNILDKGYGIIKDENNKSIESLEVLKNHSIVGITMKDGHGLFKIEQVEE